MWKEAAASSYCLEPFARAGLLLGYSDHDQEEMQGAVRKLAQLMQAVWPKPAMTKVDL